jgi:hypothetical protein
MALGWNERGPQEEHNGALRISLSASREEQPQVNGSADTAAQVMRVRLL